LGSGWHDENVPSEDVGRRLSDLLWRCSRRLRGAVLAQHAQGWVFSPFGVWLLLCVALAGARGDDRQRLEDAVGCSADEADRLLRSFLSSVPPAIATAIAVWINETATSELFDQWVQRLPDVIEIGSMPSQPDADAWTRRNTLELIQTFPVQVADLQACLVSAVATRVSWSIPFDVIDAREILRSDSPWYGVVDELLHAPNAYGASIVETTQAGKVAVYYTDAEEDVAVVCVSASPDVPRDRVLDAAQVMNTFGCGETSKCSLFDLDVGDGHSWTVTERERLAWQPGQRFEWISDAYMPAWTHQSSTDLLASNTFAADAAIATLQRVTSRSGPAGAKQTAVATFDRYGFEAAAVTAMGFATSGRPRDPTETGIERVAQLRFDHPFAAIAVDSSDSIDSPTWNGLPLFEAWITTPKEPEPERDRPIPERMR
jgi:Serpin (serine protease inhibitor)